MRVTARDVRSTAKIVALVAGLLLPATCAQAVPITLTTSLTGTQESPPNASPGVGSANVILDPALHTLQVIAAFSGLTANTTAAHIHCCTPPGANAIVATQTPSFPFFPLGVTFGVYISPVFDLTLASSYNTAFIAAHGGTVASAEADFVAALLGGLTYLNIHTSAFMAGEIRGQLEATPLPGALLLFLSALSGFGLMMRFRQLRV